MSRTADSVARLRLVADLSTNVASLMSDVATATSDISTLEENMPLLSIPCSRMLSGTISLANLVMTKGFDTTLYTGNGAPQVIANEIDQNSQWGDNESERFGGLAWIKSRNAIASHALVNSFFPGKQLCTDSTATMLNNSDIGDFSNTGLNLAGNTASSNWKVNNSGDNYAMWNFQTTNRVSATNGSPELISNGTFDNDTTGWTASGSAVISVNSTRLKINASTTAAAYASQTINTVIGKKYTVRFDIATYGGAAARNRGVIVLRPDGTTVISSAYAQVFTTHIILTFTALDTSSIIRLAVDAAAINDYSEFDNVSCKENVNPTNHGKFWECHYNSDSGYTQLLFEGSGSAGHEIPHFLGRELGFFVSRPLSLVNGWNAQYRSNNYLALNTTASEVAAATVATDFGKDYVTLGVSLGVNGLSSAYIAYGWANSYFDSAQKLIGNFEVGTYAGTGTSNNKIFTRGGKPAFVMVKRLDGTGNWAIFDNKRNEIIPSGLDGTLWANLNSAEVSNQNNITFSEEGFSLEAIGGSEINTAGAKHLYFAVFDTNANDGGSYYPKATDNSNVQITDAQIMYSKGYINGSARNVADILDGTQTVIPYNGYTRGYNWLKRIFNTRYEAVQYAPIFGEDPFKSTLNYSADFLFNGKWYSRLFNSALKDTINTHDIFGDNSCIATYKFDGDVLDLGGNYNGVATNVSFVTAKYGQGISLSGNGYVRASAIAINTATQAHSISGTFKTTTPGKGIFLLSSDLDGNYSTQVGINSSGCLVLSSATNYGANLVTTKFVTDGAFHHVAYSYNGAGIYSFYCDGEFLGNLSHTGYAASQGLWIGGVSGAIGSSYGFVGVIDEVRIFNKVISLSEVQNLANEVVIGGSAIVTEYTIPQTYLPIKVFADAKTLQPTFTENWEYTAIELGKTFGINSLEVSKPATGTFVDFDVPAWAKRFTVGVDAVSTNGTSNLQAQFGVELGVLVNSYNSFCQTNSSCITSTSGALFTFSNAAANAIFGKIKIDKMTDNRILTDSIISQRTGLIVMSGSGSVTLPDALSKIRLTTVNGSDLFDGGNFTLSFEG